MPRKKFAAEFGLPSGFGGKNGSAKERFGGKNGSAKERFGGDCGALSGAFSLAEGKGSAAEFRLPRGKGEKFGRLGDKKIQQY